MCVCTKIQWKAKNDERYQADLLSDETEIERKWKRKINILCELAKRHNWVNIENSPRKLVLNKYENSNFAETEKRKVTYIFGRIEKNKSALPYHCVIVGSICFCWLRWLNLIIFNLLSLSPSTEQLWIILLPARERCLFLFIWPADSERERERATGGPFWADISWSILLFESIFISQISNKTYLYIEVVLLLLQQSSRRIHWVMPLRLIDHRILWNNWHTEWIFLKLYFHLQTIDAIHLATMHQFSSAPIHMIIDSQNYHALRSIDECGLVNRCKLIRSPNGCCTDDGIHRRRIQHVSRQIFRMETQFKRLTKHWFIISNIKWNRMLINAAAWYLTVSHTSDAYCHWYQLENVIIH